MKGLLFLCVANSARSQMAEALARARFPGAKIQSAGSSPSRVNPFAMAVMAERGLSLDEHESKSVETIDPESVDVVVTLCAEEVCPAFLGNAVRLHWPFDDPAPPGADDLQREQMLERFRSTADAIDARLPELEPHLR